METDSRAKRIFNYSETFEFAGLHFPGSDEVADLLTITGANVSFSDFDLGTVELGGSFGGAAFPRIEVMATRTGQRIVLAISAKKQALETILYLLQKNPRSAQGPFFSVVRF
jgi:hypothetical protein